MSSRPQLAVANWKLNGDNALVETMLSALKQIDVGNAEVVVCPSFAYLALMGQQQKGFTLGGQNVSAHRKGAYTGEVSAQMLKDCGAQYVILGHSERRSIFAETDALIAEKFNVVVEQGLKPILCVGETERQRNDNQTEAVISAQILAIVETVGIKAFENAVVAYEPVWAIGTGKTATAQMAQDVHQFIRKLLSVYDETIAQAMPILYGGSVNAGNSVQLFAQKDIDGGLVGGASLKPEEFTAICQSFTGNA